MFIKYHLEGNLDQHSWHLIVGDQGSEIAPGENGSILLQGLIINEADGDLEVHVFTVYFLRFISFLLKRILTLAVFFTNCIYIL